MKVASLTAQVLGLLLVPLATLALAFIWKFGVLRSLNEKAQMASFVKKSLIFSALLLGILFFFVRYFYLELGSWGAYFFPLWIFTCGFLVEAWRSGFAKKREN